MLQETAAPGARLFVEVGMVARHPATALLVAALSIAAARASLAQIPRLVKDLNTSGAGSGSFIQVEMGGFLYLVAEEPDHGAELWKTDGTAEGTTLVKDVWPGPTPSDPFFVASAGGAVFFQPDTEEFGRELWKSDGSPDGTVLVRDIVPGPGTSFPSDLVAVGDTLFFFANDLIHGTELWVSDGTEAGTRMVKDILTTELPERSFGLGPLWLTASGGSVFFQVDDGIHGDELWVSDGTEDGTRMVKDLYPGERGSDPEQLFDWNGTLYFAATDGEHGQELWRTDGTEAGTILVRDIFEGERSSFPYGLAVVGDTLFFDAEDGEHGSELWKTDGTEAGTVLVRDVRPGGSSGGAFSIVDVGGTAFFFAYDYDRQDELFREVWELWTSDGTEAGTQLVSEVRPGGLGFLDTQAVELGGNLVFSGGTAALGAELWVSDGTESGTGPIRDIHPGASESLPLGLTRLGERVLFAADDGDHGRELWTSDGTDAGTRLLRDINFKGTLDGSPADIAELDGVLYFAARDRTAGRELWRSDGTAAGTFVVRDINPEGDGLGTSFNVDLMVTDGRLFFFADDGARGPELWVSDGTRRGTRLVKEIVPDDPGARPFGLTATNGNVFFTTHIGRASVLWVSDGTEEGTVEVYRSRRLEPQPFAGLEDLLFFDLGGSLWVSDGTPGGTFEIADVPVAGGFKVPVGEAVTSGGLLFFTPEGNVPDAELWVSDGSRGGTLVVKDIAPGVASSSPAGLRPFGDGVLFQANDGVHGLELWFSDGTEGGTYQVCDIAPGPDSSMPIPLAQVGTEMYLAVIFDAEGSSRRELWKTDGSRAGTHFVSSAAASRRSAAAALGEVLYFNSRSGELGEELWQSDGTQRGTKLVADLAPGSAESRPRDLTVAGGNLFFSAASSRYGRELWVVGSASGGHGRLARLPDLDGLGGDEVAVVSSKLLVLDAVSGAGIVNTVPGPNLGWETIDLEVLPDVNGNGSSDLSILARKRKKARLFLRDGLTGDLLGSVRLPRGVTPLDLELVPVDAGEPARLAILSRRRLGGPAEIRLTDRGGSEGSKIVLPSCFAALDLEVTPRIERGGQPALVALGRRCHGEQGRLLVIDADTGLPLGDWDLPERLVPVDLEVVLRGPRAQGLAAVLAEKSKNGAARVLTLDLATGDTLRTTRFPRTHRSLEIEPITGRRGLQGTRVSLLQEQRHSGQVRVATRNVLSGRKLGVATFDEVLQAYELVTLADLDGLGRHGTAVLAEAECAEGGLAVIVRDAESGHRLACHSTQ